MSCCGFEVYCAIRVWNADLMVHDTCLLCACSPALVLTLAYAHVCIYLCVVVHVIVWDGAPRQGLRFNFIFSFHEALSK